MMIVVAEQVRASFVAEGKALMAALRQTGDADGAGCGMECRGAAWRRNRAWPSDAVRDVIDTPKSLRHATVLGTSEGCLKRQTGASCGALARADWRSC